MYRPLFMISLEMVSFIMIDGELTWWFSFIDQDGIALCPNEETDVYDLFGAT